MRVRHILISGLLALATLCPTIAFAQTPANGVIDMIPSDAWGAVIVRNLHGLNSKIVSVGKELSLPIGPGTMVGDPLMMLKDWLGAVEGLDDKGSIAFVLMKVEPLDAEGLQKSMVILVPCTDPKVFLDQYVAEEDKPADKAEKKEGEEAKEDAEKKEDDSKKEGGDKKADETTADADKPKLPEGVKAIEFMGQESYAAIKGKYAILAPSPEAIEAFLKAKDSMRKTMSPERLAVVEKKTDLLIWLNVADAGPAVKEPVSNTIMGFMMMAAMSDPSIANQAKSLVEGLNKFLDQSQDLQIGLTLEKAGIDLEVYYRVKPDTELAKALAGQKTSKESLLKALPAEPFFLAMGALTNSSEGKIKDARDTLGMFLDNPKITEKADPDKVKAIKDGVNELLDLAPTHQWLSFSISRLPGGDEGMIGLTVVSSNSQNAEKLLTICRKLVKQVLAACPDEEVQKYLSKVQYKEGQKVGSATVDEISLNLDEIQKLNEKDLDTKDVETVKKIIGKEGITLRLAALDADHFAMVFGGGPKRIEQLAALVKEDKAPLAEDANVKNIQSQLPTVARSFELYVCGDTIMKAVNEIAEAAGEEKPIQADIPEINAPFTIVGSVNGNTQQVNIYVPMKLIVSIKDIATAAAADKMMPMDNGGAQPKGKAKMKAKQADDGTHDPAEDKEPEEEKPAPAPSGGGLK